ncbi:hypothetical protein HYT25_04465 [Candidatus Pacearchaeota archaeon]|nr:hypothetical protein [Candidatus Pacearchaeota archaeon]
MDLEEISRERKNANIIDFYGAHYRRKPFGSRIPSRIKSIYLNYSHILLKALYTLVG